MPSTEQTPVFKNPHDLVVHIYHEHSQWIKNLIRQMVRNHADTEDIFQDFLIALLTKPNLAHKSLHKGYLRLALTHGVIDFMRRNTSYRNRLDRFSRRYSSDATGGCVLDHLISREQCAIINQIIDEKLPQSIRAALKMHLENNCSYRDIARELNLCQASVRRYLYLSRKQMKDLLSKNQIGLEQ